MRTRDISNKSDIKSVHETRARSLNRPSISFVKKKRDLHKRRQKNRQLTIYNSLYRSLNPIPLEKKGKRKKSILSKCQRTVPSAFEFIVPGDKLLGLAASHLALYMGDNTGNQRGNFLTDLNSSRPLVSLTSPSV